MEPIAIPFDAETSYGLFRDTLHLPSAHEFTVAEIEQMKQARVDNWIAAITAPIVEEPPQDGE